MTDKEKSYLLRTAAALLLAALMLVPAPAAGAKITEGQDAVGFKAKDFLKQVEVDLDQHLGKQVILLDFGSIYCSSCMITVPNLMKLRKEYTDEDLAIFNIYLDIYNPRRVIKFFQGFAKDIRLGLVIDEKLAISRAYGVDTLPTTLIIDRSGKVQRRIVGYTEEDEKEIDTIIASLVLEEPVAIAPAWKQEGAINIFAPESFTKTSQDEIFIVGSIGGEGTRDISMRLNNLGGKIVTSKDNIFHFRTNLQLAMNLIEIQSSAVDAKAQSQSVVIFRETAMREDVRSELAPYRFHINDEDKPCKNCHEMQVSLKDKSSLQQSMICNSCHKSLATDNIYAHGPITVGGCLPCHDYQSTPNKYELLTIGAQLCYNCHEKVKETIENADFIHGPTAAGMCTVCHDPHGSAEKFLLRQRTDRVCLGCHQDMTKEYSKNTIHGPVQKGECTACHDPHGAGDNKFLVLPKLELCGKCHDFTDFLHLHPVGKTPAGDVAPGTPLSSAGTTICYSCHLPHAGNLPKLARGEAEGECGRGCHDVEEESEEEE